MYGDRGSECPPASLLESPACAPLARIKSSKRTKIHSLLIFNPTHAPLTLTRSAAKDKKKQQIEKVHSCPGEDWGRWMTFWLSTNVSPNETKVFFQNKQTTTKTQQWAVNGWNDYYDFLLPIKCVCCNCRQAKVREVRKVIEYTFHDGIMVVCLGDPWSLHFP